MNRQVMKRDGGGTEADYAEDVMLKAKVLLERGLDPFKEMKDVKIILNNKLVFQSTVKNDAKITWRDDQDKLYIYE